MFILYFVFADERIGIKKIHISTDDLVSAYACFENVTRLFIYTTWYGAEKIRSQLNMTREDPTYDPNAASKVLQTKC